MTTEKKTRSTKKIKCLVLKALCDFDGNNHKVGAEITLVKKHLDHFKKVNAVKEI
jgi:hypothetical protein